MNSFVCLSCLGDWAGFRDSVVACLLLEQEKAPPVGLNPDAAAPFLARGLVTSVE